MNYLNKFFKAFEVHIIEKILEQILNFLLSRFNSKLSLIALIKGLKINLHYLVLNVYKK
jgi:hypothetical protein